MNFLAYLVDRDDQGKVHGAIQTVDASRLPAGEILIHAQWSSLNYKDALAATGHPGVVRRFPHIPGIDVAGIITESTDELFHPHEEVFVTGYDLGAGHWGGWSQYVRVPSKWVVKRPEKLSLRSAMALGTAGFTAALSVATILHHGVAPDDGEVVVTGATGGVGCVAVMLLAKLGFRVAAVTNKTSWHERLRKCGASEILPREAVVDSGGKPLLTGRWAGAVDTVGGTTLTTLIKQMRIGGCVAACGLVGGTDLPLTVHPFILRGVTLAGIDSAWCSMEKRRVIWSKLTDVWRLPDLDKVTTETDLQSIDPYIQQILAGQVAGRTLVRIG